MLSPGLVPVLTGPVASATGVSIATIYRDSYGVPHIFADDAYALWYANGYVQAQDRLWALDLLRHLGYGEGASVVGDAGFGFDVSTRRDLYTADELQAQLDAAPEDLQDALAAYADGVNRAAAELSASGNLPAEFGALQHAFEPWEALDSVAVATFLLARFGTGGGDEISNARLLARLESVLSPAAAEAAFGDVVWSDTADAYPTIPEVEGTYGSTAAQGTPKDFDDLDPAQAAALDAAKDAEPFGASTVAGSFDDAFLSYLGSPTAPWNFQWGSNALLVAPSLSSDGRALVGGGPQMGYFNPQIPYEVGLHGAGIDVVGIGVVGAIGVVLGRTGTFAWTVTSGISDQTDVVALNATGPRSYDWDGTSRDLACANEVHRIFTPPALGGGFEVREQEVCDSLIGPVIAVRKDGTGTITHFFAARTTSWMREIDSAAKWLSIDGKTNLTGFRDSLEGFAFTFNFFFAGKTAAGVETACYHHVGLHPIRNASLDPRLPVPPGTAWNWTGTMTGAELPRDCDPAQGYYANWNNLPQRGWSAGDSRELWGAIHRVERLDREVGNHLAADTDGTLNLTDVKAIVRAAATEDSLAGQIVPTILSFGPESYAPGATAALSDWAGLDYPWRANGAGTEYLDPGHTVYDRLVPVLMENVFGAEQGSFLRAVNWDPSASGEGDPHAADHGEHNNPFAVLVEALAGNTTYAWCDDATTGTVETCADVLAASFAEANLTSYGNASSVPRTPQHFTTFSALGAGPAYKMPMTNRATYYHFHVGTDTTLSGSAIPAGESGHLNAVDLALVQIQGGAGVPVNERGPLHMRDQLPLYISFGLKEVPGTATRASELAESTTLLVVPRP
ncbi:MAG: penicillin acylase family protein [Methanobacteriota archaeon]